MIRGTCTLLLLLSVAVCARTWHAFPKVGQEVPRDLGVHGMAFPTGFEPVYLA